MKKKLAVDVFEEMIPTGSSIVLMAEFSLNYSVHEEFQTTMCSKHNGFQKGQRRTLSGVRIKRNFVDILCAYKTEFIFYL